MNTGFFSHGLTIFVASKTGVFNGSEEIEANSSDSYIHHTHNSRFVSWKHALIMAPWLRVKAPIQHLHSRTWQTMANTSR